MASRDSIKGKARRRRVAGMGTAAGAFLAAATMSTGSVVTAPAARADIDDLLDPIIQPILTSLSDAVAGIDPAAATDLSSLSSLDTTIDNALNSVFGTDLISASAPAAAAAASTPDPTTATNVDIPLTVDEDTEPVVDVSVNGGPEEPVLVDTGSSGLVIPLQDIGLSDLATLGFPTGIGFGGYGGGVDFVYLTFDTTVDFDGIVSTSPTTVDVPIFSFPTSVDAPSSFQQLEADDDVVGTLGIGSNTGGPGTSPITALPGDLSDGVLVDLPQDELVLGPNAGTPIATVDGAPITTLTEDVTLPDGATISSSVFDDVDSGGVYGTISSYLVNGGGLSVPVPSGTTISVYDGSTEVYSYTTGTDSLGDSTAPTVTVVGGPAGETPIDSGVEPYLEEPIYIDYSNDTLTFDSPSG
jgi:hypothetical protein